MISAFEKEAFYAQLVQSFQRSAKVIKVLCISALVLFGAFAVLILFNGNVLGGENIAAFLVFAGLAAFCGWGVAFSRRMGDPTRNLALQDIRTGGDQIVWFYNSNTTVNGAKTFAVEFMNRNGVKRKIPARNADEQENILYGLSQLYPTAVIGYSPEINREMKNRYAK